MHGRNRVIPLRSPHSAFPEAASSRYLQFYCRSLSGILASCCTWLMLPPSDDLRHPGWVSSGCMLNRLLSIHTVKGWYCRYLQNCSVTTHLRARNSSLEEWYLGSPPFNSRLAKATGWYCPSSDSWRSMVPSPLSGGISLQPEGFLEIGKH